MEKENYNDNELFNKAVEFYDKKDYFAAIKFFKKCISKNIKFNTSSFNLGTCYIKVNAYSVAIEVFKDNLNFINVTRLTNPNLIKKEEIAANFYQLGYCYMSAYQDDLALQNFNASLAYNPNDEDAKTAFNKLLNRLNKKKH